MKSASDKPRCINYYLHNVGISEAADAVSGARLHTSTWYRDRHTTYLERILQLLFLNFSEGFEYNLRREMPFT